MTDQPVKRKKGKKVWLILVGAILGGVEIAAQTGLLQGGTSDLLQAIADAVLVEHGL